MKEQLEEQRNKLMTYGKKNMRNVWKMLSIIIMTIKYEKEESYTCL